ncbi:MAG: RidA family protein [Lachnospiraceae bacterium]|nr:RidA family protein [Lachnospiraceae bacterium]
MSKVINMDKAPKAVGPYSQAIQADSMLITSGQLPINPETAAIDSDDIKWQTRQSLENIKAILESAGESLKDVLKTTVFLSDIHDFAAMNEVYATYFAEPYPARSCFQVAALPMGAKVEIEVICKYN